MRNLRTSTRSSLFARSKGNRDALPDLLEQLSGADLLWALTETVRRKPELHHWIQRVPPPEPNGSQGKPVEPVAVDSNQTPLLASDGEEDPLLLPMGSSSLDRGWTMRSQVSHEVAGGDLPIVQFSSALYFCTQDEGVMVIDVIRIGRDDGISEVSYFTRDDTAEQGWKFAYTEGKLVFEPGEHSKEIRIPLLKSLSWDGVTQFMVELRTASSQQAGAYLGKYLKTTRVKIIDTSYFPTDKYAHLIEENKVEEYPLWTFLYEYMKLNVQSPKVRNGTIKALLVSALHNLNFLFKLFLRVYLIDYLLAKEQTNGNGDVSTTGKEVELLVVIAATVLPFATLHVCDYQKLSFGIGGGSRTKLQEELLKRFLDLRETARRDMDGGDLIVAMTHDVDELVECGYMTALKVAHSAGELAMVVVYQALAPIVFHQERRYLIIAPLLFIPVVLITFMMKRRDATAKVEKERKECHMKLLGFISFVAEQYRIIADYNKRAGCVADCEADIKALNGADRNQAQVMLNNHYFSPWIALICVSCYMYYGGKALLEGAPGTTLGMFLANVSVIDTVGSSYGAIYRALLEMQASFDSLRHITKVLNMPTDLLDRKAANRKRRARTAVMMNDLKDQFPDASNHLDLEPILLEDLEFQYFKKGFQPGTFKQVNLLGKVALPQGTMTIIKGPRSQGKTTLLRILGGVFLPDGGLCFIPAHLRVLHVSAATFFYRGTLLENVTFGMEKPKNAEEAGERRSRVQKIMLKLGITQHLMGYFAADDEHPWGKVLSQSECQILNLTRAFVFNPEVMCVDKPTALFNDIQAAKVLHLLKEFVVQKGLEQDASPAKRRPRTCIMTTDRARSLDIADKILEISNARGIEESNGTFDMEENQNTTEQGTGSEPLVEEA